MRPEVDKNTVAALRIQMRTKFGWPERMAERASLQIMLDTIYLHLAKQPDHPDPGKSYGP